jgi:hypothetical protein
LWLEPSELRRVVRHEGAHAVHQAVAGSEPFQARRHDAESFAVRAERDLPPSLGALRKPAPRLLGFPPQSHEPFDKVWIGRPGIVGEVKDKGITVRIFIEYKGIKLTTRGRSQDWAFHCGQHPIQPLPALAKNMRAAARFVAGLNTKIPAGKHQVTFLAASGNSASAGYRTLHGKGMVVVPEAEMVAGKFHDTLAHEMSHGIFEHHLHAGTKTIAPGRHRRTIFALAGLKAQGVSPDPLAQRFAQLYLDLKSTKKVPEPKSRFNPAKPPPLTGGGSQVAAGLAMVTDTLWAASPGGHPWDGVDEFVASAYGGFIREPKLLGRIVDYYAKHDRKIASLKKELFRLLQSIGSSANVTAPKSTTAADKELADLGPVPEITGIGQLGWIIDPSKMPSPTKIDCAPVIKKPVSDKELLDIIEGIESKPEKKLEPKKKPNPE